MDSNTPFIPQRAPDHHPSMDLADGVKGMYRVLDLISEPGRKANVDKVIIAQHSLRRFINTIFPGEYASSTKIDFKILDQVSIKPLGIYGCKSEIVRLLQSIGAVDEKLAHLLLAPIEVNGPQLSSGLYIVAATEANPTDERHYVIYWPEDSTWNDLAVPSVRRNRVIFMRYLTKICDQVVALLSADHSASLVLSDANDDSDNGSAGDSERLFTFEVAETIQQESAVLRPGFQMISSIIVPLEVPRYCSIDASFLGPRLLPGETTQGLLTVVHIPPRVRTETLDGCVYSKLALSHLLKSNALVLSENLDEDAVQDLVREGLERLFPTQCKEWHVRKQHVHEVFMQERREKNSAVARDLADTEESLQHVLREKVVDHVISIFPSLDRGGLSSSVGETENTGLRCSMRLSDIRKLYPTIENIIESHIEDAIVDYIPTKCWDFKVMKFGVIALSQLLGENKHLRREARSALFQAFVVEHNFQKALEILPTGSHFPTRWTSPFWSDLRAGEFNEGSFNKEMRKTVALVSDSQFLQQLESTNDEDLRSVVQTARALAQTELSSSIDAVTTKMTRAAMATQQDVYGKDLQLQVENEEREVLNIALVEFIREINKTSAGRQNSTIYLDRIEVVQESHDALDLKIKITGRLEVLETNQESELKLWIHPMDLASDDKHNMQLDPKHIPAPTISDRLSSSLLLPTSLKLVFYQLLEDQKLLLILADHDNLSVYLERLPVSNQAIQQDKPIKRLNRFMVGQSVLFAFDETKRTLVVCASTRLQLHIFMFDESLRTLQGEGGAVDLAPWYREGENSILHMVSVCGREEVALVDSSARVRIFSFLKLQFRPASLQLQTPPTSIYSSPDGSCLFVLHTHDSGSSLTAYHLETFGSTEGIALDVPEFPVEDAVLTSMASRGRVFFLVLDIHAQAVKSVAIDIRTKVTEFMLKEKGKKLYRNTRHTQHNSLLDCHAEVWTQFPVLPAVKPTSLSERQQKMLTFVADDHTKPFASYFSKLVQTFEKTTRKPTGDVLHAIGVSAAHFSPFSETVLSSWDWNVSRYRLGEWLIDLLCLVPINIAVCRANRFIPLRDGVYSVELERSLLGVEVNEIVDKLSFGWYEPIFQYYSVLKPVKVVSSMGQQSGESYLLNHLMDTSFYGSAMWTTEGVWMSVMPTDEALIVALDFEGVDSVERSPQEDALLILFNTAISNLVLFHNNFASSRDISGVFRSFQSSASVLDPVANQMLFQSKLVMIIKDVLEQDTIEITREVSLKFQHIVQQELGANFVSRLHRGKLDIIPFPEIKSREFYTLLSTLRKRLNLQNISHPVAGEFLYAMKTLMAKLNANDWRTLSHTMAEHRVKLLSSVLPIALATGYSQIKPDLIPLKDIDSDLTVQCVDTETLFYVSEHGLNPSNDREARLTALRDSRNSGKRKKELMLRRKKGMSKSARRQVDSDSKWMEEFTSHINKLIESRVNHVRLWLDSNMRRFEGDHVAIEDLRRRFDSLVIEMKANVKLCGAPCASKACQFLCIRNRLHEDDHICQNSPNCVSSHKCGYICEFCGNRGSFTDRCGLAVGHPGNHICDVSAHRTHLCGDPCKLMRGRGCLGKCTKVTGHAEDEHMCSALAHFCGEPCALKNIQLPGGKTFLCQESCSVPSEQEHDSHSCDTSACPATCELCKRRCDQPHLHGLTPGAHHLCGEAHLCSELCAAPGICQIDASPRSMEDTSARHQYTRYTQVAKRMQCIRIIPPGLFSHQGEHVHGNEKPFHFCEAQCKDCGYFCTLPLGHAQLEHETSHGIMTAIRWYFDSRDGASLELGGHNISSNGKEAPVMCNFVCSSIGRHVHIDYCRTDGNGPCDTAEAQHINDRIGPEPDEPKDAITHSLYWRRMGFKDPYTRDEQAIFGKCDATCSGPEHAATGGAPGRPSYCTLPMFHPPHNTDPADGDGYVSNDGHKFSCRNPVLSP